MLAIAILAAGKGTRMKSSLPKVLHKLADKTLVERVINACDQLNPNRRLVIVGHQATKVKHSLREFSQIEFVTQNPQNGTGHAIQQLIPALEDFNGELLVLNGDVPLISYPTLRDLLKKHRLTKAQATILTAKVPKPKGYGRVFINEDKMVDRIIEDIDCNEEQRNNTLINAGVYCFNWHQLREVLSKLSNKNNQGEIYLTDTLEKMKNTFHHEVINSKEIYGINNRVQLASCEKYIQKRLRNHWMEKGVSFIEPESCTLSEECIFGTDVVIEPQSHVRGNCKVGDNCHIGPGVFIKDSTIGNQSTVIYSVVNKSLIGDNVTIGPFTQLRPETIINNSCKIGNFVEIKNSNIKQHTKISHLSYMGDTACGENVNIGAGTIVANFDGKTKHKTILGNQTKTGANSVLVAPIKIGKGVTIGAGSTLTKDVPDDALAVSRPKQVVILKKKKAP